jgi:hypothetical protein
MDPATREDIDTSRFSWSLWTGILGPPAVWFFDQQLSYVVVPWACHSGHVAAPMLVSVLSLALLVANGIIAFRRRASTSEPATDTGDARRQFMHALAIVSTALFALSLVANAIPKLLMHPCDR